MRKYRDVLSVAGFQVTDSPWLPGVARVTLPSEAAEL
jgi:hypothetical protein